jgi:hypothetical protein
MMEVRIPLDLDEQDLFAEFAAKLDARRKAAAAAEQARWTAALDARVAEDAPSVPIAQAIDEAKAAAPTPAKRMRKAKASPEVIATIAAAETTLAAAVVEVSIDTVIDAVKAFVAAKGMPAAVGLLGEFGAKRVGDIPVARRAEFIGRTTEKTS